MKELSIKEKAKAYDEALERAKVYHKQLLDEDNPEWASEIEKIFPELKENEGERIRKWLIHYFKEVCDNVSEKEKKGVIAWLNKQGEQKPSDKVEPKFRVGDVVTNKKSKDTVKIVQILHDSYCYSGWDGAATIYSDFSISEQDDWELVELTACSEEGGSRYSEDDIAAEEKAEYNKGFECGIQRVLKYPEDFDLCKKPAWSEEDENRFSSLCWLIDQSNENEPTKNGFKSWLKLLKDKVQSQPKQEK